MSQCAYVDILRDIPIVIHGRIFFLPPKGHLCGVALEQDPFLAVIPEDHPLAGAEKFPLSAFCTEPFVRLARGENDEAAELFARSGLTPNIRFTTWDDYAVMSMVECGLGIGILPRLILQRIPYRVAAKELDVPAHRNIALAMKSRESASVATKRFVEYLEYRRDRCPHPAP